MIRGRLDKMAADMYDENVPASFFFPPYCSVAKLLECIRGQGHNNDTKS